MKRYAYVPLLLGSALLSWIAPGCDKQGEGQRCSVLNENDDCTDGLECIPGAELGADSDICCKPNGQSTNPACVPGGLTSGSSSSSSSSSGTGAAGGGGNAGGGGAGGTGATGGGGAGGAGGGGGPAGGGGAGGGTSGGGSTSS